MQAIRAVSWKRSTKANQFSLDPTEFAGKRALITGGTQGMGEAIVRRLAEVGARHPRLIGLR